MFINDINIKFGRKLGSKDKKKRLKVYHVGLGGVKRAPDFNMKKDEDLLSGTKRFRDREIKAGRMRKGLFEK